MKVKALIILGLLAGMTAACTSSGSPQATGTPATTAPPSTALSSPAYQPKIDPANFTDVIDNSLFPLKPGTRFTYKGVRDGQTQTDVVEVTSQTKLIMGVTAVAVGGCLWLTALRRRVTR